MRQQPRVRLSTYRYVALASLLWGLVVVGLVFFNWHREPVQRLSSLTASQVATAKTHSTDQISLPLLTSASDPKPSNTSTDTSQAPLFASTYEASLDELEYEWIQPVAYFSQHDQHMSLPSVEFGGFERTMVEAPRQPLSPEYRVRVGDRLLFVFYVTRYESNGPYKIGVGDRIAVASDSHEELNQEDILVLPDGTIAVSPLQSIEASGKTFPELKVLLESALREAGLREPRITVMPVEVNLPNQDLRDAVDGRQGIGGQRIEVLVNWDGNVRLPQIAAVPVVGMSLDEISREVNARYSSVVSGIEVTPILSSQAPAFVYVLGEVTRQGQIEATRPLTALQAITQAGGYLPGANLRQVLILRRTPDWQLVATRINIHKAGYGRGLACQDIWLHDGDIVIVPRVHVERLAELVELYFTRTIYSVMPNQGFSYSFVNETTIF